MVPINRHFERLENRDRKLLHRGASRYYGFGTMTVFQFATTILPLPIVALFAFWLGRRIERGTNPDAVEIKYLIAKARVEGANAVIAARIRDRQNEQGASHSEQN